MKKRIFYSEFAYCIGLLLLALGTALTAWADFGISMVVAPAYILHLKLSPVFSFFTFGMAEYTLQAAILLLMMILLKRVKLVYFLSFATAVIYGFMLDGAMVLAAMLPFTTLAARLAVYGFGVLICAAGIAFLFHTYLPPEAYELIVKELSASRGWDIHKCKTAYDCISCVVALVMSLLFFGGFEGIGVGTVACALLNGFLIGKFSHLFEGIWVFKDRFGYRKIMT